MIFVVYHCQQHTYIRTYVHTNPLGITILYVGAELVLRHIRNGVELDPIDLNRNYDFNFQQINFIPSVQILAVSTY